MSEKHVWILGAGFSRHAGGPLMNELFSDTNDSWRINFFCKSHRVPDTTRNLLCIVGSTYRERKGHQWFDVEDFLEKVDASVCGRGPEGIFATPQLYDPQLFLSTTKARIAIEVDSHLAHLQQESDRLAPYKHWASLMTANDTILTFNYDTLIEKAFELAQARYYCPLPTQGSNFDQFQDPVVLKLHGSTAWTQSGGLANNYFEDLLIATPGTSKGTFVSQLAWMWDYASEALRNADYVHIVGYRFPESDSSAILRLLNPLQSSTMVNIVLGSSSTNGHAERLMRLLEVHVGSARVHDWALYSQDYLTLDRHYRKVKPKKKSFSKMQAESRLLKKRKPEQ